MAFALSPEFEKELDAYLRHCPKKEAALIPALHLVQRQKGYVPTEAVDYLVGRLETSRAHIEGVLSFYTMFHRKPMGRHIISVCSTLSCAMGGSRNLVRRLEDKLGVKPGETTADGAISLVKVECLAACDKAPVLMVNDTLHRNLTPQKLDELLATLSRNGHPNRKQG